MNVRSLTQPSIRTRFIGRRQSFFGRVANDGICVPTVFDFSHFRPRMSVRAASDFGTAVLVAIALTIVAPTSKARGASLSTSDGQNRPGSGEEDVTAQQQYERARMLLRGIQTPRDDAKALALLRSAAERGLPRAQSELGVLYSEGDMVAPDQIEAVYWFRKAAMNGLADGQLNLGLAYVNGMGVPWDPAEAVRWFRLSARQGNVEAQFNLGVAYTNGDGVRADISKARRWFTLSAEHGYAPAKQVLESEPRLGSRH